MVYVLSNSVIANL